MTTCRNASDINWVQKGTVVILVARDRAVSWQRQSSSSFHGCISGNTFRTPIAPFSWLVSHNISLVLAAVDNGKKMTTSLPDFSHFLLFHRFYSFIDSDIYILYRNGRVKKNKKQERHGLFIVNYVRRMKDEHRRKERREGRQLQCKVKWVKQGRSGNEDNRIWNLIKACHFAHQTSHIHRKFWWPFLVG